ncbi:unnamed protein product [Leuciscus chuanchicus]
MMMMRGYGEEKHPRSCSTKNQICELGVECDPRRCVTEALRRSAVPGTDGAPPAGRRAILPNMSQRHDGSARSPWEIPKRGGEEKASHPTPDIYSGTNPNARPSRNKKGKNQAVLHS